MKLLLRILGYLRPYRFLVFITLFCAALTTAFELVPPWLIKVTIDDVIQAQQIDILPWVLGGLIVAYGLKNIFNSLRIRLNNILEQHVIFSLREQVFHTVQRLSISYFEERSTGEIMSRVVNDTEQVERIFIDGLEGMLTAFLTLIGITIMLFAVNWKLALLALIPIPILVISSVKFSGRMHRHYHDIRKCAGNLNAYLQDALSGIREIMGFNRHAYEQVRFDQKIRDLSRSNLKAMFLWSIYSPSMIFVGSLGTVLVLWYGAEEVIRGTLTLGELVMFLSYLALFYVPVNQIHSVNHMLQHAIASAERIFDVLDAVPEVEDCPSLVEPTKKFEGSIQFTNVLFSYRPDIQVLHGISLEISAGESVAFVGPSGAGKSTLLKLLMRFYDVNGGEITIDSQDIRDLPLTLLRNQVGLVQQEPFLFNGTVQENIAYGNLEATREEIERVAIASRAHEFIMDLPDTYDTWTGERGVKLSAGQKQRVSIARVLLKNPPIVIFDEATSNIDTETEVKIREALSYLIKDRTTLIIAHRLSTLQHVDRIVVLDHGNIVEQGSHADLRFRGGLYANLYDAQFHV